jgi:DNA-binding transcriptional LysR family regulator
MDLRHIRYFLAVAEEKHITRAAERLGIQQPPLSQQIKALEDELDVRLFRRLPRGVELTDAGESLLPDARAIMGQVERALAKVKRTARGEQGAIVVGFTSSAPFHPFLPDVIRQFREIHPGVSLKLEEAGTSALVTAIQSEEMDAAFIRSPAANRQGLAVHELFEEDMLIALPSSHRYAPLPTGEKSRPLALDALADEAFILYRRPEGPGLHDGIIAACHRAGFNPRVEQEAPRIVSTLNLVAAGLGVSLVPTSLGELQMKGISYRRLKRGTNLVAPLNLACRALNPTTAANNFVRLVRAAARH